MARWDHGYVTDVAYTTNAFQEATPAWLTACSILLGYRPPDLATPFRYADLGCGNGLNALIAAATNPHSDVWGFDFNPTHIENARWMAAQAGLANVHFEEMSFEELAGKPVDTFDIVVAHGVLSWISLENRRHLTAAIGRLLRPGGLAYLSYNTTPGWSGVEPIRLLMRQLAGHDQQRTDQSAAAIFQIVDQLRAGGATFFRAHPGLAARLDEMRAQHPRYIAHEFLNRDWHPVMFADVAEAMADTKTSYIGSATVMENIDAISVQEAILPVLYVTRDPATRETIRDLASAKSFRRDLWRKGGEPLPDRERLAMLDVMTLVWTGKPLEAEITFPGPIGVVTGQEEFYRPMLSAIRDAPTTIGRLRALPALQGRQVGEFLQSTILMMGGGFVHPAWPHHREIRTRESTARLNATIVERLRLGLDVPRIAAPLIGSSVAIDMIEGLVIAQLLDHGPDEVETLVDGVLSDVLLSGRSMMRDGQQLTNPGEVRALVGDMVRGVLARRLSPWRGLGVID
jgi:SAM-dependent methyltransferase